MVGMQRHDQRSKACIGHHFALRVIYFQSGILRVDLLLRLGQRNARFKPSDHLDGISPGMPLQWGAIFRPRCQGKVKTRLRREELKARWQYANDCGGIAVHTNLLTNNIGVCIGVVSPESIGHDRNMIGTERGLVFVESASDDRAEPKSGEKVRRDFASLVRVLSIRSHR